MRQALKRAKKSFKYGTNAQPISLEYLANFGVDVEKPM